MWRLNLFLLIAVLVYTGKCSSYYVATNGNNGNPGTLAQPFLTVQKGLDTVAAGDTLYITAGYYTNEANMVTKASGTLVSPIIIQGDSTNTIIGGNFFDSRHSNCIYRGINFITYQIRVYTNTYNSIWESNALRQIYCLDNLFPGATNGIGECIVRYNLFHFPSNNTMCFFNGRDHLICSNRFEDSGGWDATGANGCRITFSYNWFENVSDSTNNGNHCDIIQVSGGGGQHGYDVLFSNNYITNCAGQLAQLTCAQDTNIHHWTFRNNVIYGSGGMLVGNIPWLFVYNNTWIYCRANYCITFEYNTNALYGLADNSRCFNNIFYGCGVQPNNGDYTTDARFTNFIADYNFKARTNDSPISPHPPNYTELYGINGGNPMFVNWTNGNLYPAPGSPLLNAGTNLSSIFTDDYTGKTRGPLWDMGAYEADFIHATILGKAKFLGKATIR